MDQTQYLIVDYETRSEADLKKVGGYEYAVHPSTKVLCVGWKLGRKDELRSAPTKVWSPAIPSPYGELIKALCDPTVVKVAHNAFFEQVITRHVLSRIVHRPELLTLPHSAWICTASMAAAMALPRKLEHVCAALKLPFQKDMEGHRLMLKYCKPRKPTKNNPAKWHSNLAELKRIMAYCGADIDAETELFLTLPELHPTERQIWLLDQEINFRGFRVDRPLVKTVLGMISEETKRLHAETREITGGKLNSVLQRDALLKFINSPLPDLKAKTVREALSTPGLLEGVPRRLLEIRQDVSKTSTKKYLSLEMRSRTDGRCRDILMYHAASTGRWGGQGVQPHNFPKGVINDPLYAVEVLKESKDLETLRLLWGSPMDVFSSILRPMIIASEGKEFFCADWNAVEARGVFWIAGHEEGLDAFASGKEIYKEMASHIWKIEVNQVDDLKRDLGKRAILGCGFGMGPPKFKETCWLQGNVDIPIELAERAVKAYRSLHYPVVNLWSNLERAAIYAVKHPGKKVTVNKTSWYVRGKYLFCELPSGRRLAYYGPSLRSRLTPWGEKRPVLYHWGVDPKTKKWVDSGTYGGRLTENVVQATARDIMSFALLKASTRGYEINLSVHDEILAEKEKGKGSVEEFENILSELPPWAQDFPTKVKAWKGNRYRK